MKKVMIHHDNHKAIAFFKRLSEKKAELKERIMPRLKLEIIRERV